MRENRYVLVNSEILPEVYRKVLLAKTQLATGKATSASQAAKMAGISRSAYYKYKDAIYEYRQAEVGETVTLFANLIDNPGVLSNVMSFLYQAGANILSVNQNIPVNNVASVSIAIRVNEMESDVDELFEKIRQLNGVKSVDEIK